MGNAGHDGTIVEARRASAATCRSAGAITDGVEEIPDSQSALNNISRTCSAHCLIYTKLCSALLEWIVTPIGRSRSLPVFLWRSLVNARLLSSLLSSLTGLKCMVAYAHIRSRKLDGRIACKESSDGQLNTRRDDCRM